MARFRLSRWLPDTLAWWVFMVLVAVVVFMCGTTLVFLLANRNDAGIIAAASQAADQVIVIKRMIERDQPEDRLLLVRRLNSPLMRIVITRNPVVDQSDDSLASRVVLRKLQREFRSGTDIRVDSVVGQLTRGEAFPREDEAVPPESIEIPTPAMPERPVVRVPGERFSAEEREARMLRQMQLRGTPPLDEQGAFRVSIKFAENTWFNARVLLTVGEDAQSRIRPLIFMTFISMFIGLAALWGVYRAFRPLAIFAGAAERLGVDVNAAPLTEEGPSEVRRAARAFNTMQSRLKRFIQDRTQMLAAISHDLRTPITRLRLRAEFVDDDDQRAKMLKDLEEMEQMIAATLAFSRDDAASEPVVPLDLGGLLGGLAADYRAGRHDVGYDGPARLDVDARPLALKRALTNLIDNAIKYGERARISINSLGDAVEILIDDDGPGIPERDHERVFAPFVRLEASRSRETGGVGLGLTIARNTIRGMGGDVELATRMQGGLRVRVTLPLAEIERIAAE